MFYTFSLNRKRLFSMINDLPTVFEVVTGRKPTKDKPGMDSGSKSKNSTKVKLFLLLSPRGMKVTKTIILSILSFSIRSLPIFRFVTHLCFVEIN